MTTARKSTKTAESAAQDTPDTPIFASEEKGAAQRACDFHNGAEAASLEIAHEANGWHDVLDAGRRWRASLARQGR